MLENNICDKERYVIRPGKRSCLLFNRDWWLCNLNHRYICIHARVHLLPPQRRSLQRILISEPKVLNAVLVVNGRNTQRGE